MACRLLRLLFLAGAAGLLLQEDTAAVGATAASQHSQRSDGEIYTPTPSVV